MRLPKNPRGKKKRSLIETLLIVGAAGLLGGIIAFIGLVAWVAKDLPDPNNISNRTVAQTTQIFDRTGEDVLYQVYGNQKRTLVELEDVADYAIKATIAAEDRDFYSHKGFAPRGMLRGVRNNLLNMISRKNRKLQSGSTITQQFIKKSILSDEQTIIRKVKEIILAIEIERRFSKDEILKLYLNEIPYGAVAYGIESAAQSFFDKKSSELTISEAAILVSLPKGPTYYSPYGNHIDALIARQHYVINSMVEEGYITEEQAEEARADEVLDRIQPRREPITAPHFVFYVRDFLAEKFGEQAVEKGGLRVFTTLDTELQEAAEESIEDGIENVKRYDGNSAALLSLDAKTGDILAMVGSADYFDDEINGKFNSLTSKLQPGSSIKPIVYASAFERGFTPSTVVYDVETTFKNDPKDYTPVNYDGSTRGPMTLKESLAGSLNIPAVKVMYMVGIKPFIEFANKLGYTTLDPRRVGLSLVLGGVEISPMEHISAFTAFAQDGTWHGPRAVLRVEDANGEVLYDAADEGDTGKEAVDVQAARKVNDILSDNEARAYVFGAESYLTLPDRPVAAKTGTTNKFKDAWTVGYTPSLVTGVWTGHSRGETMKVGADGSVVAAPIWNSFMRKALAGTPVESFTPPDEDVTGKAILDGDRNAQATVRVDKASGKLATEHTPEDYVVEKRYGSPHSILFFVDKSDPRGPAPDNPESDPQFANWEEAIALWAEDKEFDAGEPPTEYDDVHLPENKPSINIIRPSHNGRINERTFVPEVFASAPRGIAKIEYSMDGEYIGEQLNGARTGITIPNRFAKGFHTLSATAFDDVGNRRSVEVTVNLTAPAGPIGVTWNNITPFQLIFRSQFPHPVRFSIDDPKSVSKLRLSAKRDGSESEELIGLIDHPALSKFSYSWNSAPQTGRYQIIVTAELLSGETRSESITVDIR